MALKNIGLVIFLGFLQSNREMFSAYDEQKEDLIDSVLRGSVLINTPQLSAEIERRFGDIFNNWFIRGQAQSKLLVDKEVVLLSDALKVPFRYNRDVIDLINDQSVFKGFSDTLYKERFSRGEVDRIKRVLLTGTYNNTDELLIRQELEKSFNLTKKRAQLLARGETKRLRETTKTIYFQQEEVQKKYNLVWNSIGDERTRDSHQELNQKVANSKGEFYSPTFGTVKAPPLEYNCRCFTTFVEKI